MVMPLCCNQDSDLEPLSLLDAYFARQNTLTPATVMLCFCIQSFDSAAPDDMNFLFSQRRMHFLFFQAKPFINEAHVFNDAGLSFDVWPPRNGSSAADAPPKPIAINPADDSSHPSDPTASSDDHILRPQDDICLADHAIAAEEGTQFAVGENDAIESVASLTNDSSGGVTAAGEVVGSDISISRGYLLAVKLWEETIATVNAKHRSSAHLGSK